MKSRSRLLLLLTFFLILPNISHAQKKGNAKKDIAIQLYSVRERIGSHVSNQSGNYSVEYAAILKELAQIGYTAVESAGYHEGLFYGRKPEVFKQDVEAAGLKVLSSHCNKHLTAEELASGNFSESLKWWDACIAAHKAAGMTYVVVPWLGTPQTVKELKTYCDYYNEIGRRCKQNGMKFGYHNHAHEFEKVENKVVMMDYMIENTDPEYVFIEMDVYWTVVGKSSPVDYFKKYPNRFTVLHIKDHREVGQSGMVGFDAIFNHADVAGVKHIVVELEGHTEGLEKGLKTSIDYLLKAPFVKASYGK
ncbi:sugar phosphate isomerase/epimerase [Bacteroides sp. 51]|uniref:sugar phosphate isomerase/epimerase family protein n=1 Tax=Bacteroides sp. 51 TaxID=2302938 RepID=UPI0013D0BD8A|nr:sugar phosphate isomerase/epimerase [Bacteroides sp. 51]NDV80948.1 sugar phosphate isomerase/epimerase [Bacteroides sp. 51]